MWSASFSRHKVDEKIKGFKLVDFERESGWDGFNDYLSVHDVLPVSDPYVRICLFFF